MAEAYPDRAVSTGCSATWSRPAGSGKKSGAGFRKYSGKGKAEDDPAFDAILVKHRTGRVDDSTADEITDRLFLPMLLEATRVLEEGIVREPADVDMGLILGIGFPPFRGGILRWADSVGAAEILRSWRQYRSLGKRFEPTETLTRQATPPAGRSIPGRRWPDGLNRPSWVEPEGTESHETRRRHRRRPDPVGRASADKGYYRDVRSEDLSAHVMRALLERTGIDPDLIEDVRWGCVQQQGEQGFDVARIAVARRRPADRGRAG